MPKSPRRDRPDSPIVREHSEAPSKPEVSYVEASEGDDGQRVDNFLLRILKDAPRSLIYRILRSGEV
ncbi:MAG: 23S rRNA pseudouridine(955/2504/2580) synthase, partial [Povalibacter sp.]